MPSKFLHIAEANGKTLAGSLELPQGTILGAALFAHCFTCTRQSKAAVAISRALSDRGIACLRFDFTGLGGSEGEFGREGLAGDIDDLVAVGRYLFERFERRILLVGHSLGGAAVLAAADDIGRDRIAAIATIGAPAEVSHTIERIDGDLAAIERDGEGPVTIGGRSFTISRAFLHRMHAVDLLAEVSALDLPLMIFHSPTDELVGIENAAALFAAARHPKSFVSLDRAEHLLLDAADAHFAADMISAWSRRYMTDPRA